MPRPLLCTAHPDLLDDVLRLAAAAGAELDVAADAPSARRSWSAAPLVIVGADLVDRVGAAALPRRTDVVLVGLDLDDAGIWQSAVTIGAQHVVFLPDGEPWLVDALADTLDSDGRPATVLAVLGGRGGAGASTLATALAVTGLLQGISTMLVDADPLGGGIDLLLGGENATGLRWQDLAATRGRVSAAVLSEALPRVNDLTVLSWDRGNALTIPPDAMAALLPAARQSADLVVVDLPRALDDSARVALAASTLCLLVVPAEVRGCAAAARVAASVAELTDDLRVVVRGPSPGGLRAERIAQHLGLPLAGYLRRERGLAAALEHGAAPASNGSGHLARFCQRLLTDELALPRRGRTAA